jgi:hypothetical protein
LSATGVAYRVDKSLLVHYRSGGDGAQLALRYARIDGQHVV